MALVPFGNQSRFRKCTGDGNRCRPTPHLSCGEIRTVSAFMAHVVRISPQLFVRLDFDAVGRVVATVYREWKYFLKP